MLVDACRADRRELPPAVHRRGGRGPDHRQAAPLQGLPLPPRHQELHDPGRRLLQPQRHRSARPQPAARRLLHGPGSPPPAARPGSPAPPPSPFHSAQPPPAADRADAPAPPARPTCPPPAPSAPCQPDDTALAALRPLQAASPSTAPSLRTRTSTSSTRRPACCPWPTRAPEPTARSSSSPRCPRPTWTAGELAPHAARRTPHACRAAALARLGCLRREGGGAEAPGPGAPRLQARRVRAGAARHGRGAGCGEHPDRATGQGGLAPAPSSGSTWLIRRRGRSCTRCWGLCAQRALQRGLPQQLAWLAASPAAGPRRGRRRLRRAAHRHRRQQPARPHSAQPPPTCRHRCCC
jgi:translation initiation factor IF-2